MQQEHLGTQWLKPYCDFLSPHRRSLHLSFLVWCSVCRTRRHGCPLSASLQWLPQMLLVSLLPHYNPLCVLCEWLMMIMQMRHQRAAWVIITGENEAFWNSLTAEEKTVGLQCVWVYIYQYIHQASEGRRDRGRGDAYQTFRGFSELYALWYFYPR